MPREEKPRAAGSFISALGEVEEERSLEVKGKGLFLVAAMLAVFILAASCKKSHSKRTPPHIDSIERVTVRAYPSDWGLEGDVVRLDGSSFAVAASVNTVTFEGIAATVLLAKGNQLTVFVPVGTSAGVVAVKVAVGSLESNEVDFTILQIPTITALVPDFGPKGALVTVQGRYFGVLPGDNVITFPHVADPANQRIQSPTLSATPSELTCFVPPEAVTGDVTVEVGPDTSDPVRFTVTTPRLDRVEAFFGAVDSAVVLSGENFSPDPLENIVRFNGVEAPVLFSSSFGNSISTLVPANARSGPVTVEVTGGRGTTNGLPFCLEGTPVSVPTSIVATPATGAVGDPVWIDGADFSTNPSENQVSFNGTLAPVANATSTRIQSEVPLGAVTGPITVTVAGQTVATFGDFTVTSPPPLSPGIFGLIPDIGPEGSYVTIRGTNFSPVASNNRVFFNGVEADVCGASRWGLLVTVPFASSGLVTVDVGGQATAGGLPFTVTGQVAGGSTFTYFGQTLPAPSNRVIFVIDISGTMDWTYGTFTDRFGGTFFNGTRLDLVKDRTAAAIRSLPTTNFFFNVIAFDCQPRAWSPTLMASNLQNQNNAINLFVNTLLPSGSSNTGIGGSAALAMDPLVRTVTLVSDGLPTCGPTSPAAHLCEILTANTEGAQIHTFAVQGFGDFVVFMQDMAGLTGGTSNVAN